MSADCAVEVVGLPVAAVKNLPWQLRAHRAGLNQAELARLAGAGETTVSKGLQGKTKDGQVPVYLRTIIRLWEVSDRKAREAILAEPEADADA